MAEDKAQKSAFYLDKIAFNNSTFVRPQLYITVGVFCVYL